MVLVSQAPIWEAIPGLLWRHGRCWMTAQEQPGRAQLGALREQS